MTLPRAMRQVLRPSKLTRALARDSCGMWICTSEASGMTRGLHQRCSLRPGVDQRGLLASAYRERSKRKRASCRLHMARKPVCRSCTRRECS